MKAIKTLSLFSCIIFFITQLCATEFIVKLGNDEEIKIEESTFERKLPFTYPATAPVTPVEKYLTLDDEASSSSFSCSSSSSCSSTDNTIKIRTLFFPAAKKSTKKKLVVFGSGIPGSLAGEIWIANAIFEDYDRVIFRYRWQDPKKDIGIDTIISSWIKKNISSVFPGTIFGNLFELTKQEVKTVTNYYKAQEEYDEVVAFPNSYSSYPFFKAHIESQEEGKPLFDKFLSAACWNTLKKISGNMFTGLLGTLVPWIAPASIATEPLVKKLQCKQMLMLYGIDDVLIKPDTFKSVRKCVNKEVPTTAIITPDGHNIVFHRLKQVCKMFIDSERHEDFQNKLREALA